MADANEVKDRGRALVRRLDVRSSGSGVRGADRVHVVDLDTVDWQRPPVLGMEDPIRVGVASRLLPPEAQTFIESLTFTIAPGGPGRGWVNADVPSEAPASEPAAVLLQVLSVAESLPVEQGLVAESLAYSMLLAGPQFAQWRARTPRGRPSSGGEPVLVRRRGNVLHVELNRPERHNAFGQAVRDGLIDALDIARWDDSCDEVVITGAGPSFCSGGDLDEFGTAPDVVTAHFVRLRRSAGLAIHQLRDKVRPVLHGACIGAGIEVPAFAGHVVARRNAYFRLPEIGMGLIPGAGGTVSITRRIGRWRTAYLALTGRTIDAEMALDWGLVDELA